MQFHADDNKKKVKQESYERKNYNQTTRQSGKVFKVIGFLKVKHTQPARVWFRQAKY